MLLGKNGRGNEHGGLLSSLYRPKSGTDCYFGFSVAHVAHEKPVHGGSAFHIGQDLRDRGELVPGFDVGEGLLELAEKTVTLREGKPLDQFTPGVELNQFPDVLLHPFTGPPDGVFPLRSPKGIKPDVFTHVIRERGYLVKLEHRQEETLPVSEFEYEAVHHFSRDGYLLGTAEDAETVFVMNEELPF